MTTRVRILAGAGVVAALMASPARAASEVDAGGYLNDALQAAHADLVGGTASIGRPSLGGIRINVEAGEASAVTGFTPRFGGLSFGRGRSGLDYGSLLKTRLAVDSEPASERRGLKIGPGESAEIGGLQVDVAAIAELEDGADAPESSSAFAVGGEMAISGLHLDATVGQGRGPLGLEGNRMSAGLGYDFGSIDTRVSYAVVENEEEMTEASLFSLGSQLTLNPGLVLEGDLAYAEERGGDVTTAGRLSLRFNF